jgi:transposase
MEQLYYVGLDIHKRTINYCVKDPRGEIVGEGRIGASRGDLEQWRKGLPQPWVGAMEATLFTGWIYDQLSEQGAQVKVADPSMLKAITASKKKNDQIDARKIADLLRCNLLPECYMGPREIRELRRILRYRQLLVRQCVQMKNRIAGFLMETGTVYEARRLHGRKYFQQMLQDLEGAVPESVIGLLGLSRSTVELLRRMERQLIQGLVVQPSLEQRVHRLSSIPGVGVVTALSWALEVGEPQRFRSVSQAVSYCGLCSAQISSAEKNYRNPISKKRNHHLQHVLVEAAKLAPRWNPPLAAVHSQALERGNRNRATLAVARKLVAYLLAVDRSGKPFQMRALSDANQVRSDSQAA